MQSRRLSMISTHASFCYSFLDYITKRFFEFSTMCLVAARPKKHLLVMIICEEKHGRILPQVIHRAKMRSLSVAKSKLAQARPPEVSLSLGATREFWLALKEERTSADYQNRLYSWDSQRKMTANFNFRAFLF